MLQRLSRLMFALAVTVPTFVVAQDQNKAAVVASSASSATPVGEVDSASQVAARVAVIVEEFSVAPKAGWPYDIKQLQSQTLAELKAKSKGKIDVLIGAPATPRTHTYTLGGEILSWHPGNRAKRMMVGMGSGRETAEIHYWLTDENGRRVFEHRDTIRAEFWGNAYAGSVGELAHPFASKIAVRLVEAEVF